MAGFPVEDELLAAVLAAPDEDAPRLVYADWLLEQPDPLSRVYGELITTQCELPRLVYGDYRRRVLARRATELLRSHRAKLVRRVLPAPVGEGQIRVGFARGFVETLTSDEHRLDARSLCFMLPKICAGAPIRRLALECVVAQQWDMVLADPTVAGLRELAVTGHSVESPPLRTLPSASLTRLHALAVDLHGTTQGLAAAALGAAELPSLRELSFAESELAGVALEPLLDAPYVPSLTSLSLRGRALSGAARIVAAPFRDLQRLSLAFPDVFDADLEALGELRGLRHLGLDTHHGWATQRGWSVPTLAQLLGRLPGLRSLAIGGDTTPADLAQLLRTFALVNLQAFEFRTWASPDLEMKLIAEAPALAGLRELEIVGDFADAGPLALASSPHLQGLQRLKLGRGRINRATAVKIFTLLPKLETLDYRPTIRRR